MTSLPIDALSLLDVVLVLALAATIAYAVGLRREFKRFRAYNGEYADVLAQTGRAMEGVERAVERVQTEGGSVLVSLGERIEEARALAARLEALRGTPPGEAPAPRPSLALAETALGEAPQPAPDTPAPFRPRPDQKPKAYAWPTVVVKRLSDDT